MNHNARKTNSTFHNATLHLLIAVDEDNVFCTQLNTFGSVCFVNIRDGSNFMTVMQVRCTYDFIHTDWTRKCCGIAFVLL